MIDKQLLNLVKEKKKYIVFNVINQVIALLMNLAITFSIILVIKFSIENDWKFIAIFSSTTLVCAIIRFLNYYFGTKLTNMIGDFASIKLRGMMLNKFFKLKNRHSIRTNDMSQLSTEGIEQLKLYYAVFLPSFFFSMIAPILLFIFMSFINWKVSLIYLAAVPLIPASIVIVSKWAKKIFNKYWDKYMNMGNSFADNINGLKELKIFNADKRALVKMDIEAEEFRKITMKVLVMQLASVTIMDLVAFGGAAIGIVVSLISYFDGSVDIYLTIFMILVGAEFFLPMRSLGSAFHMAMNGATAGKKILDILNYDDQVDGTLKCQSIKSINLKNLSYKIQDKLILDKINLKLEKNKFYCLIGESGSGKSSLTKILAKLNLDYDGSLLINDNSLSDLISSSYHDRICYLANDSIIYSDTIRNNFKFYNSSITDKEIITLLKEFKLNSLLDKGLDYKINDSASNISGGEKQRLMLACNLSKPYDFYIFDEITSNVDNDSEQIIIDLIKNKCKQSIVMFITHRMKNILKADYVINLKDKKIAEFGKVNDLLKTKSMTKNLFNEQKKLEQLYEANISF